MFLRRFALMSLVAATVLLVACTAAPQRIVGTGAEVAPPEGFVNWCDRHPSDPGCKPLYDAGILERR